MAKRPAVLWSAALAVLLLLAAACTTAAAVTISRKQHHRGRASASASAGSCAPFAASGAWVVDESYPLYDSAQCPFIRDEFACERFGRPDTMYLKYRWQLDAPCAQPSWDYIQVGNTVVKDMDRTQAFTKALHTWARWVEANLVHTDTKVFFQGISPSHYRGQDWGASPKKTCMGETRPLNGTGPYPGGPIPQQAILRGVLAGMAKPVYLLDFTYLSQLRKDAHPTKYDGGIFGGDCTHWCVAGLPDTWNVLFYAALTGQD